MTFQLGVALVPWIVFWCFLIFACYFASEIWQRFLSIWYGFVLRYWLWRARKEGE